MYSYYYHNIVSILKWCEKILKKMLNFLKII